MPGVNSQCKTRSYVTLCISCVHIQTNASVDSSENSTTLLGMPIYPDRSSSLLWTLSHANLSLCCPVSTALSVVRCQLLLRIPLSNSLLAFPYPLPVTPRSRVQNPLSGFAPKQRNRLLGGPPTQCYSLSYGVSTDTDHHLQGVLTTRINLTQSFRRHPVFALS